ncbi:MAG: urate oxidase, partial [bacterium]
AFVRGGSERRQASITLDRQAVAVTGGLDGLLVMKTAHSAFSGFLRDAWTTLADTDDRIFRTVISARWSWEPGTTDFGPFEAARRHLLEVFAAHDSRSVQETLMAMGEAVLSGVSAISEIRLSLPNQHCLPVNLAPFGLPNRNEIFIVTEEPHGLIEATIGRR